MNILQAISLFVLLGCVNGLTRKYYFINEQNADDDQSSKEELTDQKEESNENNDFKFDDQSTFKDSDEEEKDAANELYEFWNNLDMCNDVSCKGDQVCITNKDNTAVCVDKIKENGKRGSSKKKCTQCPKLDKMDDIYCASNNRSYSSLCELVQFNCVHNTDFYPMCQDDCPCSKKTNVNKKLKLDYLWKYVNKNFQLAKSHLKEDEEKREPKRKLNNNQIKAKKQLNQKKAPVCSARELNEMGQRLFNWFSVILKNQLTNENERSTKILNKIRASLVENCDENVNFVFMNLDVNKDLKLSSDELYHLEHDQSEKCLKLYVDSCDLNDDQVLNNEEWCKCYFQYRPCLKERNSLLSGNPMKSKKLSVSYLPSCDKNGYFQSLQCNKFTKYCWCVDKKNGNEIANSRKLGKVVCDKLKVNKIKHPIDDDDSEGDDDFDDYQSETEGSGD